MNKHLRLNLSSSNTVYQSRRRLPALISFIVAVLCITSIAFAAIPDEYKNQYLHVASNTGPFGNDLSVRTSLLGFNNVSRVINGNPNSAATLGLGGLLGAWIEVEYDDVFPAGTEVSFITSAGLLNVSLFGGLELTTYNGNTQVSQKSGRSLLGISLLGGKDKIGLVSEGAFNRVRLTVSGVNLSVLTSILGADATVSVYYAEVMVPKAGVFNPNECNAEVRINQTDFPAVANYTSPALLGGIANADAVNLINSMSNVANVVSSDVDDYASLSPLNVTVLGDTYLSVKLLAGTIPNNTYAGFEISNTIGLLSNVNLLGGITIQAYNNGTLVQEEGSFNLLSGTVIGTETERHTVGMLVTNGEYNELRLKFGNAVLSALATLGETRIYGVVVKQFCPPTGSLNGTVILANGHSSTNGMGVTVNSRNAGLANIALVGNESIGATMGNLIDNIFGNFVKISSLLGAQLANGATLSVATPGYTFNQPAKLAGFIIKRSNPLLDLVLMKGVKIKTYNNGQLQEEASVDNNLLKLNVLNLINIGDFPPDAEAVYMTTSLPFNEIRMEVDDLAGVGDELQVFAAFANADEPPALPVTFGEVHATLENNNLFIKWATLKETNNAEFIVEASTDGKNWTQIGKLNTKANGGNSDITLEYTFTKGLGGLVLGGFGIMALLSMPFFRNRFIRGGLLVAFLILVGVSCSKNKDYISNPDVSDLYIRIAQVDKNGDVTYSKVVKVIKK